MDNDQDFDSDGGDFGLLESGNGVVNSLISDFASALDVSSLQRGYVS